MSECELKEKYLFKVSLDDDDFCVFACTPLEAIEKVNQAEFQDVSASCNLSVEMLCFENDIINLNEINR